METNAVSSLLETMPVEILHRIGNALQEWQSWARLRQSSSLLCQALPAKAELLEVFPAILRKAVPPVRYPSTTREWYNALRSMSGGQWCLKRVRGTVADDHQSLPYHIKFEKLRDNSCLQLRWSCTDASHEFPRVWICRGLEAPYGNVWVEAHWCHGAWRVIGDSGDTVAATTKIADGYNLVVGLQIPSALVFGVRGGFVGRMADHADGRILFVVQWAAVLYHFVVHPETKAILHCLEANHPLDTVQLASCSTLLQKYWTLLTSPLEDTTVREILQDRMHVASWARIKDLPVPGGMTVGELSDYLCTI